MTFAHAVFIFVVLNKCFKNNYSDKCLGPFQDGRNRVDELNDNSLPKDSQQRHFG